MSIATLARKYFSPRISPLERVWLVPAWLLLGLYGIPYALFFGLARGSDSAPLLAQAWIAADRILVTGGHSFEKYTVVECFVAPHLLKADAPR